MGRNNNLCMTAAMQWNDHGFQQSRGKEEHGDRKGIFKLYNELGKFGEQASAYKFCSQKELRLRPMFTTL